MFARARVAGAAAPLVLALVLTGCASAPRASREPPPLSAAARPAHNRAVFDAAWRLVDRKYFDPHFRGVDWGAMKTAYRPRAEAAADEPALYRVLEQLCAELRESHLAPLPPRRAHEIATQHRTAVGMSWVLLDGRRVVTALVPGGPAELAGVRPGWIVVSRNGTPLADLAPAPPPPDETVTYGFLDLANAPQSITFHPQLLETDRRIARDLPGGYRYLRFDRFSFATVHWLSGELKAHPDAPGVVLDLRQNPGGLVVSYELAVGEFFDHRVPTGHFVTRAGRVSNERGLAWFSARYRGRVVILTGATTGSAAEIFTHVLQHHGRATVVGRRTAGAVIVARNYALPGGGELQVPVEDYVGLDGQRLEGHGVFPDVPVARADREDLAAGRDPDLTAALAVLNSVPAIPARDGVPRPDRPIATVH